MNRCPSQFLRFVVNALRGDLGYSIRTKTSVTQEIGDNYLSTLQLAFAGLFLAALLGTALGIIAAVKQYSWVDAGSMMFALIGVSMPSFWLGLLLIFTFSLRFRLFPATGGGDLKTSGLAGFDHWGWAPRRSSRVWCGRACWKCCVRSMSPRRVPRG